MRLSDFDYDLPKGYIAQHPLDKRDSSKLMVLEQKSIAHRTFHDILSYLKKDDVLVVNDSKVIPARIRGRKSTGGRAELLILKKLGQKTYRCMFAGRNFRENTVFITDKGNIRAEITGIDDNICIAEFEKDISSILDTIGEMPTPPYIKEKLKNNDRYQTIYADKKKTGSLAAPTAGFHFTEELLDEIRDKGVKIAKVTLHVSLATFLPVHTEDLSCHKTGKEMYEIGKEAADIINNRKGRLFVVGTTALKTLESAADDEGKVVPQRSCSELFIYPGHKFRLRYHALITNFHLPKSTLIMLVSAFAEDQGGKDRIFEAYEEAKKNNYRFFSFGDAMLIFR